MSHILSYGSFARDPCVTVRVGATGQAVDFSVHKSVLCQSSPFFEAAVEKDWQEKKNNLIELPEDEPEVFEEYFAWLYSKSHVSRSGKSTPINEINADFEHMRKLWMFGDKVLDHDFCDMVVDALISTAKLVGRWPIPSIFKIREVCGPNAPIRQFLVDMYLHLAHDTWFEEKYNLNVDAYKEIVHAFALKKSTSPTKANAPWTLDGCVYHWHKKEGGICYKDKDYWVGDKK